MGQTDTITFTCSACNHSAEFPKAQEGKAIYCPKCQAAQVVKAPGTGSGSYKAERIPTGRIVKAEGTSEVEPSAQPHGMAGTARIDFVCGACNHTSRISAALSGQPVRCPTCGTVQLAGVAGLRVVKLDGSGKLPFTCTSCNYQVRLNADYAGKAIRCPKCQGAQVVPRILRDPSGTFQALPPGAPAARSEPGSGTIKRPATGSFPKAPPVAQRSEPSPALRTPAGGIQPAQPMATPTPLPRSYSTPPPGALNGPVPEPTASASSTLPAVATDETTLDLGTPAEAMPAKPRSGGVVRRSGRMGATRTPRPGDEPTLEAARAVQPEPDSERHEAPAARAVAPVKAATPSPRQGAPAWLVPVLGVAGLAAGIACVVLLLMLSSASDRENGLKQQLAAETKRKTEASAEASELQRKLGVSEANRQLVINERDELRVNHEAMRRESEQLKAEIERLKAEATAKPTPPVW